MSNSVLFLVIQTFFYCLLESKCNIYSDSITLYSVHDVIAGLFYDAIGNEIGAEMALGEAHRLNMAAAVAAAKAIKDEELAQHAAAAGAGATGDHPAATEDCSHECKDDAAAVAAQPPTDGMKSKWIFKAVSCCKLLHGAC